MDRVDQKKTVMNPYDEALFNPLTKSLSYRGISYNGERQEIERMVMCFSISAVRSFDVSSGVTVRSEKRSDGNRV